MKTSFYLKRIMNDKVKLAFIILLFIFPLLDLIFTFIYVPSGATPQKADFNTILSCTSSEFMFHSLTFYFIPIYLLLISGDDCFEDCSTGYRNILILKWGKKSYIKTNIMKAFFISFAILFLSLALNLLMSHIIYNGVNDSDFINQLIYEQGASLFYTEVTHPFITNICYIFIASLLAGLLGASGAALAMAIKNRKIVYPLHFLLWYLMMSMDKSIMLALQPFNEYGPDTKVPVYSIAIILFAGVTVIAAVKEMYYAKI